MKEWSRNTWYEFHASMGALTETHFNVSNKQKFWLQPPNSLCPVYARSILEVVNKRIYFNLVVYEKYIDMLGDSFQFGFLLNFLFCLPSVVFWWQGILPPVWEKATTNGRPVPKAASFWSSEGYSGKQPANPERSEIPDRQHVHEANRALWLLEGL